MKKIGLVLEGGGFRGVYTSGVLDALMELNIQIPYVIGVSMGACNGSAYISNQKGRNKKVNINYVNDSKYMSFRRLITKRELFGTDYIFDYIPKKIEKFDFKEFHNSKKTFKMVVTNMNTGKAEYLEANEDDDRLMKILQASSSLPLISKEVHIDNSLYLDGGIADPIPISKALSDGCEKLIVVLTRNREYEKKPEKTMSLVRKRYKQYNNFCETFSKRHEYYNTSRESLFQLEKEGKAFIIAPEKPLNAKRIDKNKERLREDYAIGYKDGIKLKEELLNFINS